MKPLDPRLTRYARAARRYIATTAVTGVLIAGLVVAQAWLISRIVAPLMAGGAAGAGTASLVRALAAVVAARAAVVHFQESRAHRAATRTIIELRRRVVAHAAALGPRWQAVNAARTATVLTRGLDDLEPYFTRYLPQLILASTLTPLTALVMLLQDAPSTLAVALTIPLIPVFMILIGRLTRQHSAERLAAMERLGAQVLDLVAGLPTLKALGREIGPGTRIERLGRAYNRTTMATLRVAFLSGAVLEFITTLSVAIIAVEVGLRLLFGRMDPATGLLVIMIAPEVYQPLRRVGLHFHASANGVAAADAVFEILDAPLPERGELPAPDLSRAAIRIEDVSPNTEVSELKPLIDYLVSARVPFQIATVPYYVDANGVYNNGKSETKTFDKNPQLLALLKYAQKHGGTIVQHGTTHQYGKLNNPYTGVTADDFEFYRSWCTAQQNGGTPVACTNSTWVQLAGAVPDDSVSWAANRVNLGRSELKRVGLGNTKLFETPHYAASWNSYTGMRKVYSTRYERELFFPGMLNKANKGNKGNFGLFYPYTVTNNYNTKILPENLGNYEPEAYNTHPPRSGADLVNNAKANLAVTDGNASFFFHPGYPLNELKVAVEGIKGLGYNFTPATQLN